MLAPNNNRGVTYQTDEKHLNNMSKYFVGVVNIVFNRYLFIGGTNTRYGENSQVKSSR